MMLEDVLKPAESKNIPKQIAEFQKAFKDLLEQAAGVEQLVVLIDDLRSLPARNCDRNS